MSSIFLVVLCFADLCMFLFPIPCLCHFLSVEGGGSSGGMVFRMLLLTPRCWSLPLPLHSQPHYTLVTLYSNPPSHDYIKSENNTNIIQVRCLFLMGRGVLEMSVLVVPTKTINQLQHFGKGWRLVCERRAAPTSTITDNNHRRVGTLGCG